MISTDWSTTWRMRSRIAGSVGVSRTNPPPAFSTSRERWPVVPANPPSGCDNSLSFVRPCCKSFSRMRTSTELPRMTGALVSPIRSVRNPTHVVLQREQLLPPHVVGVDLEQDVRAALQVEAEHDVALRPIRPALDGAFREEVGN